MAGRAGRNFLVAQEIVVRQRRRDHGERSPSVSQPVLLAERVGEMRAASTQLVEAEDARRPKS
jgi:hypothetical protein